MKTVVTGGTGFVGSHLVNRLLARGDNVTCFVRDPDKASRLFTTPRPNVVRGSLDDQAALANAFRDADVVFHLAGAIAARDRAHFFAINAEGTARVVAAAKEAAPALRRLVYVSSLAAAGPSSGTTPRRETDPPSPVTNYGASKLAAEEAVRKSGVPWTIVRPPAIYGPRDREFLRVFKLSRIGVVPVFGDGSQRLSLVYVEDLVEGLIAAAERTPPDRTYFAAHPEVTTSRAFVTAVYRAVRQSANGVPAILPIPGAVARPILFLTGAAAQLMGQSTVLSADKADEFLADAWTCSSEQLERDAQWRATHDIANGLPKTAAWYRAQGWL